MRRTRHHFHGILVEDLEQNQDIAKGSFVVSCTGWKCSTRHSAFVYES